jgi:hypothetical protein
MVSLKKTLQTKKKKTEQKLNIIWTIDVSREWNRTFKKSGKGKEKEILFKGKTTTLDQKFFN